MDEIQRMQDNLLLICRAVGWNAEEFGNQIRVTKQTINNIENGRNKLTKTQCIAMRSVLDVEIAICPEETDMLRTMPDVFVDHPDKYKEEDKNSLLDKANLVTPSILPGTASRKAVSKEWMQAATGLGIAAAFATRSMGVVEGLMSAWLMKVVSATDRKDKKGELNG